MTETKSAESKSAELTTDQTAVLQLVTITPQPRTIEELANTYAGLREANLWPEQSTDQVKARLKELVTSKHLKYGEKAGVEDGDGDPTIELTAAD
jgi:hypothetical protein